MEIFSKNRLGQPWDHTETDSDGRFQVVGVPGKGVIDILVWKRNFPTGQGYDKIDKNRFQPNGTLKVYGFPSDPDNDTAVQEVNI